MEAKPGEPPVAVPSVWRNRVFTSLFVAQAASLTGTGISAIALGLLAYELVGASVSEVVGIVLTIRILARVLLAPWASQVARALGTKPAMLLGDGLCALAVVGFFFVTDVWQIYALAILLNVANAIFMPLYKATIPRIVTREQYPKALAYSSMAYQIANISGPAISGLLVATIGVRGNFLLDATTFVLSMAIVWWAPRQYFQTRAEHLAEEAEAAAKGQKPSALRGVIAVFKRKMLREAFLLEWHSGISGGLILVATVDYVKTTLHGTNEQYAWVMAVYGLGALVGAWLYSLAGERLHKIVIATTPWVLTAVLLFVPIHESYVLLILGWTIAGAGGVVVNVRANQYLAENSEPAEREAVYAAQFSLSHVIWLGTYPLAGFATTWFGFAGACWLFAGLNFALQAIRWLLHKWE